MKPVQRKALLLCFLALAVAFAWVRPIDATAQAYVDSGFKRALVTFASARALNALISVAQGASVSFQIGAGASIQPGAVLDPIDDLVEQFSVIMLAATLSFAMQNLLIAVFGSWPFSLVLSIAFGAWGVQLWRDRSAPLWLSRAAVGLLFLSLAVPVVALASEATYRLLLASSYETAQAQIKTSTTADTAPVATDETSLDKLKRIWAQGADVGRQVEELKAKANGLVEHIVRLAAVFIVQTIVLPIFLLWTLLQLYRLSIPRRDVMVVPS
jgi:hypothetical protein